MSTLTFAWRSLRRAPIFALAAALTLSIGIGATTAIFTVLDTVLIKPLPYPNPDRLMGIWVALPGMGFDAAPQSTSSYFTFKRLSHLIDGIGVVDRSSVNLDSDNGSDKPERVRAGLVSASVFTLLGTRFERGRGFTANEDAPRGDPVVVLSDGMWRGRFGADPSVIGKTVKIDGQSRHIVGVAPASFTFPDAATQLWLPIALDSATPYGGAFGHQAFVRVKPGVTRDALQRELDGLMPRIAELYPNIAPGMPTQGFLTTTHAHIVVHAMRADVIGNFASTVWIAGSAGILLLLISFANVASLLLTRAEGRQRELAVRVALGAGPRQVLSQYLAESVVLAAIGGAFGLFLATIGVHVFLHAGPPGIPRLAEMGIDSNVIVFALVVTVAMAVLCSAVPALRYDSRRLATRLRDATRGGTSGRDRQRARRSLVVAQVALATVLVAGAGMLAESFQQLRRVQPGFDVDHTLTMFLSLPPTAYRSDTDVVRFATQLDDRIRALPGVRAAAVSSKVPFNPIGINFTPVYSDADRDATNKLPPSAEVVTVSGDYFATMGIPLVAGHTFDRGDRQSTKELIVDRTLAKRTWNDSTSAAAVGRRIRFADQWYTVIGVVGAVRDTSLAAAPTSLVYAPNAAGEDSTESLVSRTFAVVVRTAGDPHALINPVEHAIAGVDRSLPPFSVSAMSETVERSMARLTFIMTIIGVTAIVALALAAIGLYGVLAYVVSLRTREISVRLAMGALPGGVARLVTGQGATLAAAGVVLGVIIFILASRFLRAVVAGAGRPDVLTIAVVTAALMLVAVAASWIPARRAARIDPARALAGE